MLLICIFNIDTVTCSVLSVSKGEVSYSESLVYGGYPVNTTASFACDYEYALSGPESSICEASGTWNEQDQKCKKGQVEGICQLKRIGAHFMQRKKFKAKILTVTK